jgi:uncharacterized membrane protein
MRSHHPVVERYMARLEQAISGLDAENRREVLQEIRNHIAEAMAAGKRLDVILESLGPADALGRGYAIELLMHPPSAPRQNIVQRWLKIVGLLVTLSIPTLAIVSTLGSIGVSFVAAGIASFVVGVGEVAGVVPSQAVSDLPFGVPILVGPPLFLAGVMSLLVLRSYARSVARAVKAALA